MSAFDLAVLWCNVAGASLACIVNLHAVRNGWPGWGWLRLIVAGFSAFYVASYATFALGWWDLADWSPFMRGVSVPVWWFVWALPAEFSIHTWRQAVGSARSGQDREPADVR